MRLVMIPTLLVVLSSGCAPTVSNSCAGWKAIYMGADTPAWLIAHDRQTLADIVAHNEFGQSQGCWK